MWKKVRSLVGKAVRFAGSCGSKALAGVLAVGGSLALLAGNAHAALSVDQQAVVDGIDTLISDMSTVGWGFVLTMTTLFVGIKVFKKVIGRTV